jgi:glutathione S-transferase
MAILFYDLAGQGDRRFSPNCWRTRMALVHKGLDHEARGVRFIDIPGIAGGGQKMVPVIDDGGHVVADSWAIAEYLEQRYPDRPSLFGGPAGHALTRVLNGWVSATLHPMIVRMIVLDIHDQLVPEDKAYFRATREKRFGAPLEEVQAGREKRVEDLRAALAPARLALEAQPWLAGASPGYADYLLFGALQWPRAASAFPMLADGDPLRAWLDRCLDLHGGLGRATPART